MFMQCHLDGSWSFPASLSINDIENAERITLAKAIDKITVLKPVAAVPHMFCITGMTSVRGLFELVRIPVVGNSLDLLAIMANKWRTKCVLKEAGIPVPKGELLKREMTSHEIPIPTLAPPFIIKPCSDDNSRGLSLYRGDEGGTRLREMLEYAFSIDNEVIVEEYIPLGYEVRAAVIEDGNKNLVVLPKMNYILNEQQQPCRFFEDKFVVSEAGVSMTTNQVYELPATSLPEHVAMEIDRYAKLAHIALGCRLYSLYDFRVSPEGVPHILEATLVCSYGDESLIVRMNKAWNDREPYELFQIGLERTVEEWKRKSGE